MAAVAAIAMLGLVGRAHAAGDVAYPRSVPPWAIPANDAGVAPATQTIAGELHLELQHPDEAIALATAVSTPGVPDDGRAITRQQWIDRFSPPASVYDGLVRYLKYNGLTITGTPESRLFVVFRGTAEQLGSIFGARMHAYSVDGHKLVAPSSAPRLPADIAAFVSGMELGQGHDDVTGLGAIDVETVRRAVS